ncbi:hypothetical protein ABH926_007493 [Catenulispora sp. GP43]|uniref:hypothetical protein n=1 Tax=Catenulispora sp. GP43 TaxID=3156263 RepID=UPI003519671F
MSEGFPEADNDVEWLHGTMATATAHLEAVRTDPARLRHAQRRRRLSEGGVAAGVLSVALVAAGIAMQGGGGGAAKTPALTGPTRTSQAPTTAPSSPADLIKPADVSVYDEDDGSEDTPGAAAVLAGTGAWTTNQYCQRFATYEGVVKSTGLVFDLGQATTLADATVDIGIPGAGLEMWAADPSVQAMPAVRPGQPPAGFTKVAAAENAETKTVLTPARPTTTRFVLVWFTTPLPAVPDPDKSIRCAHDDGNLYGDSITAVQFARG